MPSPVLSQEQRQLGYRIFYGKIIPPVADCKEIFRQAFQPLVARYHIRKGRGTELESRRVAYLGSLILTKIFGSMLSTDAEYEFFWWARKERLHCDAVLEREFKPPDKQGRRRIVERPYPYAYEKFYKNITFGTYIKIAHEAIMPAREPILRRTPVTRL